MLLDTAGVLLLSAPPVMAWLVAASGFGWVLARWLVPESDDRILQVGLGVAALLVLDAGLGALGVLSLAGGGGAWAVTLVGLALTAEQLRRGPRATHGIVLWPAAPALVVLTLAACSSPGWLWATEFGGYDAMSYHLQLPKEWLALGRIEPVAHNVYSFLPGYMEAAYYHLALLPADAIEAVHACQLLHAALAVFTALAAGRVASSWMGPSVGRVTGCLILGTPWVVVVGSLAYNEMATAFFLAAGLLALRGGAASWRTGAAVGLLAAAACGAKLTAIGFVALPLVILMLMGARRRHWPLLLVAAAVAALLSLLPWLLRNTLHGGNPFFPFAGGLFGHLHWTPEQAEIFAASHRFQGGPGARLAATWNQLFRFGIGGPPATGEPWSPQWSILPWLAIAGLAAAATDVRLRAHALKLGVVLAAQLVFWFVATHLKSRFLLPMVVPAALAVALGGYAVAAGLGTRSSPGLARAAVNLALLLWCAFPVFVYSNEPFTNRSLRGDHSPDAPTARIGAALILTGDTLRPAERRAIANVSPVVTVNWLLDRSDRVLLVGDAKPLYYRAEIVYQTTWDRGPLSATMDVAGDDPQAWMDGLRSEGFTYLLVEPTMLEIWARRGWGDPRLEPGRILDAADRFATLRAEYPGGARLYELTAPIPRRNRP